MITRLMQAGGATSAWLKQSYRKSPKTAILATGVVSGLLIVFLGVGRAARTTESIKAASRDPLAVIENVDASPDSIDFYTSDMNAAFHTGAAGPAAGSAEAPARIVRFSGTSATAGEKRFYRFSQDRISRHMATIDLDLSLDEATPDIWPRAQEAPQFYYFPPPWPPEIGPGPFPDDDDPDPLIYDKKKDPGSADPDLIVSSAVPLPSTLVLIFWGTIGILGIRQQHRREGEGGHGL